MTANERTGWRDKEISARHRKWGFNCPAVDLDFLMVEYNMGKPVGLVEYKMYKSSMILNLKHATYRALKSLADSAKIPFFVAYYYPDIWAFKVVTVNEYSKTWYENKIYTEKQYVEILYKIRSKTIEDVVYSKLNNRLPEKMLNSRYKKNTDKCKGLDEF